MRTFRLGLLLAAFSILFGLQAGSASARCADGLRCFNLEVPLDRTGAVPGTLELPVVAEKGDQPLLVFLAGGPGQGFASHGESVFGFLNAVNPGYRYAVLDERGTGADAVDCPALQRADISDLTVPPPGSVEACGRQLGTTRGFYTTTDKVADLEALRISLDADRMAIWGTSYGTYVAVRYARAFPDRVSRLVLDSVVTQENVDPFFTPGMRRTAVVLQQVCKLGYCRGVTKDPVADLSRLVRRLKSQPITGRVRLKPGAKRQSVRIDGPALYDLVVSISSFDPKSMIRFPAKVRSALKGKTGPMLRQALRTKRDGATSSVESLSWGSHVATLCGDIGNWPWGGASASKSGRYAATIDAVNALPARRFAPFDRATAAGNGALVQCRRWPTTPVSPPPAPGPLPPVPTIMFAGGWDLSTPLKEARDEMKRSSTAKLVVIPMAGHGSVGFVPCTMLVIRRFMRDQPLGKPCVGNRPDLG